MKKASKKSTKLRTMRTKVRNPRRRGIGTRFRLPTRPCPTCSLNPPPGAPPTPGIGVIPDRRRDFATTSIVQIARKLGIDPSTVSRIFSKNAAVARDTTFTKAAKIADYLGVTLDELRVMIETKR